ncbi:unnamed protein product [Lactuca saligna]|uniref:Ubiquitin-like protease family profile domain-containing protein n=1 Tax=Lactuca saligna TaxID=75948 RepID=A0AA35YTA7_LACSI|nr:unnamed protein product [Lactuca saligna]
MENVRPKKRGERGIAAFKSKISPEKYKVKFDKNNIPDDGMPAQFSSWFGMKVRRSFPIDIESRKAGEKYFKDLWLETKKQWNIESNDQEKYLKRKAVKLASNFKSFLVSNFVNQELNACLKYDFIKPDEWERFVAQKTTPEFLEQEEKRMIADGSYFQNKEDPLVRLLGREHGGRSRTISNIIGHTQVYGGLFKNVENSRTTRPRQQVDMIPSLHESSGASGGRLTEYPPIKVRTECELLVNVVDTQLIVANGIAWPTSETVIHSQPISTGCVKVQVDEIVKIYENLPVHAVTRTEEVEYVKHLLHTIVQWPRYAIKLVNKTPSKSNSGTGMGSNRASPHIHVDDIMTTSAYRPQFEDNHIAYQHEINEHFQGGLVDMMLSMNPPQVHLNAPKPRARPEPESEFESELEYESESESETEPEFVTHDEPDLFTSLSKLQEQRPQIQSVGFQVVEFFGNANVVNIFSPKGMYRRRVQITIQYIEVLQLFLRDWLDQSIIHWFAMLLFRSPNSECAFFDPLCIARLNTKTDMSPVTKHIEEVFSYHKSKRYFLAPYLQGMHWLLFILCPESKCGYILDSLCEKNQEKKKDAYHFPSFIDNVFPGRVNKWETVKCYKQKGGWECGFIVIKHMKEFVENKLWKKKSFVTPVKLEDMVSEIIPRLIKMVNDSRKRTF